jgi:glycosyltransferase involved in cell wall biosynthesis
MKVLMFGWEFPPFNKGGLGTACHGLTKGLTNQDVDVTFVLPKAPEEADGGHVKLLKANALAFWDTLKIKKVDSLLTEYVSQEVYDERVEGYLHQVRSNSGDNLYGKDLHHEVWRFGKVAGLIAKHEDHDVIHSHDWMTYEAGMEAKKHSGKPLVVHVHATEFDRTGGHNVNEYVYGIEKKGMETADRIVTVSNYTKQMVVSKYGIDPGKIEVVHNAVEFTDYKGGNTIENSDKIVLFLGRITIQKGPDWFLYAARKVLDKNPDVKFIFAGEGDMEAMIINKAAELGMADKVLFSGFLKGTDIDKAYQMADLYVMPSVSEPFGITPLEAMQNGTPVLMSKQSGVSEVVQHCLKCDFWDVDEMANMMASVLQYSALQEQLSENGGQEVMKFSWDEPAAQCLQVYDQICGGGNHG